MQHHNSECDLMCVATKLKRYINETTDMADTQLHQISPSIIKNHMYKVFTVCFKTYMYSDLIPIILKAPTNNKRTAQLVHIKRRHHEMIFSDVQITIEMKYKMLVKLNKFGHRIIIGVCALI